jgi:hypothetical protein
VMARCSWWRDACDGEMLHGGELHVVAKYSMGGEIICVVAVRLSVQ